MWKFFIKLSKEYVMTLFMTFDVFICMSYNRKHKQISRGCLLKVGKKYDENYFSAPHVVFQ
jgi:hypothetical protein